MEPNLGHRYRKLSHRGIAIILTVLVTAGGTGLGGDALLAGDRVTGFHGEAPAAVSDAPASRADEAPRTSPAEDAFHEGFAGLPDPAGWSQEPTTDLDYRRTTDREQAENGWSVSSFLVEEGPLRSAEGARSNLTLAVPLADGMASPLTLQKTNDTQQATFTAIHVDGGADSRELTLYRYHGRLTMGNDTGTFRLTVDEAGGYYLHGRIGDLRISMSPSVDWWITDTLPAVDDEVPEREQLAIAQLSLDQRDTFPGLSRLVPNRTDQVSASSPGTTTHTVYKFGLMGEMKWCTRYESSWQSKINTIGDQITNGFSNTNVDIGQYHDHCWLADTLQDAKDCANNGGCYDAQGHAYPYNGDGDDASAYLADAWDDVSHSREHYSFDGLHIAHVIHDGLLDTSFGGVCGDANAPPSGASAAAGLPLPSGCEDYVSTHEVGHNFDATHDNTVENGCGTVMAQSSQVGCRWNYFNEPGQTEVSDCGNTDGCPRWGTG